MSEFFGALFPELSGVKNSDMFSFSISFVTYLLLASCCVCVLLTYVYALRPYIRAASFHSPEQNPETESAREVPKVSVIVYCQADDDVLAEVVAAISRQDYPDFEIIVVCDANDEHAELLSERFSAIYDNVYVTFIQPGSHNLSRRKLAFTIGIKAAKGEVVLTTSANVEIPSERWLSQMMAPFCGAAGKHNDVSLGLSMMDFSEMRGLWKWYRQFDDVLSNALWVGYAAGGHPYRGDGYNLAFRRSVFFDHKGYARTINLHYGDDDLFVHEISTGSNTRVTVTPDDLLVTKWGDSSNRVWSMRKAAYSFTSRWLPKTPFVQSAVLTVLQWLVPGLAAVSALTGLPCLYPAIAALLLLCVFWGMEIFHYRRLAARFGAVRLWWAVVPFMLWRPIGNLIFSYDHRNSRKKNFTWQR